MSTSVPIICAGCGCKCGGTVFYEDDRPYHHGCRPSQRLQRLNAETNRWCEDWGDAQKRIAELEAENERLKRDRDESDSAWQCRCEQAEARVEALKARCRKEMERSNERIAELEEGIG